MFRPSQRVALDSLNILAEQKDQLKEINSKRFFTEFGETLAPRLEVANWRVERINHVEQSHVSRRVG